MEKTYSQIMSEYVAGLKFEDIPQDVIDQAKRVTLHAIGASVGGYPLPLTGKVIGYTQRNGGTGEATIWCSDGRKVPVEEAAFANGTMADHMDWEDCTWTGHPSATGVPAAMAVAEKHKKSGREYLLALVAGYESSQRIAMAAQPTRDYVTSGRDWALVSWQIFAASMAAAKLMGFDAKRIEQVLGASLYQAQIAANKHSTGSGKSDIYHYAHGFAARNGVVAAQVTELGYDNCYHALDGDDGYWHMVSDRLDESWYTKDLGKLWMIRDANYLKHWPANMWVQIPLEGMSELVKEQPFQMEEVDKIRVTPDLDFIMGVYSKTTRTILDAQFSIPYCLTAFLMNPKMGAHWFTKEMLNNQELIDFTDKFEAFGEKIVFYDNFEIFKSGSFPEFKLEVYLKDGRVLHKSKQFPKGHPKNNFTLAEEYDHFRLCCSPYLPQEQIERFIAIVDKLEEAQDLDELIGLTTIRG
ncbi:hypothetical protein CE91St43_17870 [Oscillospiraceae bacterium]|nr:hypothetical protein CE91St43_17870 [Oscillospiraceae bacterium]